jgi:hypothetical protein
LAVTRAKYHAGRVIEHVNLSTFAIVDEHVVARVLNFQ